MSRSSIIISGGGISEVVNEKKYNRKSLNKFSRNRKNKKSDNTRSAHGGRPAMKPRYKFLVFLLMLLFAAFGIMKYAEINIRPIIVSMAEAHAKSIASRVVGEAINDEIVANNINYDDLVSFEKDTNGKITALKTNIITVNQLKSRLSVDILNKLANMSDINLYIPVGNLVDGEFFSGRGPRLEIILLPVGSVTTNITNVFSSAGINQTRLQIMLEVRVTVSIIMPFSVESTDVSTSIAIAETIIVGDVPNMYMQSSNGTGGETFIPVVPAATVPVTNSEN